MCWYQLQLQRNSCLGPSLPTLLSEKKTMSNKNKTINYSYPDPNTPIPTPNVIISKFLVPFTDTQNPAPTRKKNMCYDCETYSTEQTKRDHLNHRVDRIHRDLTTALQRKYGLVDDETPKTFKELLDRLTTGMYVIDKKYLELEEYNPRNCLLNVEWRDPSKESDQAGYNKANEKLTVAWRKVLDDVVILPVLEALASVREFEKAKFS